VLFVVKTSESYYFEIFCHSSNTKVDQPVQGAEEEV